MIRPLDNKSVLGNADSAIGGPVAYARSVKVIASARECVATIVIGVVREEYASAEYSAIDISASSGALPNLSDVFSLVALPVLAGDTEVGGSVETNGPASVNLAETAAQARVLGSHPNATGPLPMPADASAAASCETCSKVAAGDLKHRHTKRNMLRLLLKPQSLVLLLGLAIVLWVFLQARRAKDLAYPQRARIQGRPIPVRTALVAQAQTEQVIGGAAVTAPSARASIRIGPSRGLSANSPASDVVLKAVHVWEGQRVARGQLLAEIDDTILRQVLRQTELALESARAEREVAEQAVLLNPGIRKLELVSAEANLKFRTADLEYQEKMKEATKRLIKAGYYFELLIYESRAKCTGAAFQVSEATLLVQSAERALKVGPLSDKKELAKAVNEFEMAKTDLEMARHDVERARIISPITGFVSNLVAVPGAVVPVDAILMDVVRLDPIYVQIDFPQERMDQIAAGQDVEFVLDGLPRETFRGRLIEILSQANPDLRVIPVLVEVANHANRIKAGLTGFVRLRWTCTATTVPAAAVRRRKQTDTVFCVKDGRARIRNVRVGRLLQTGLLEVQDGLVPGEEVIIFENFYRHAGSVTEYESYVRDNDPVDVDWRKWVRRE